MVWVFVPRVRVFCSWSVVDVDGCAAGWGGLWGLVCMMCGCVGLGCTEIGGEVLISVSSQDEDGVWGRSDGVHNGMHGGGYALRFNCVSSGS